MIHGRRTFLPDASCWRSWRPKATTYTRTRTRTSSGSRPNSSSSAWRTRRRRRKGTSVQDCNDPMSWPFATIARLAAAKHPDLVIHVGDYHYRESPCPADRLGCAGSPHGDNWAVWQKDLFDPAAPLLAAAPW